MKRVCLLFCAILLCCACAGRADSEAGFVKRLPSGGVEVVCEQLCEGGEYVFMALTGYEGPDSLESGSILELGQFTADSARASVALIGSGYEDAVFVIGGTFADGESPKVIRAGAVSEASLPASLTTIEDEAFLNCAFRLVYLSDGIAAIGSRAFKGCGQLCYIHIPSTVEWIADDAFEGCDSLMIGCERNSTAYRFAQRMGIEAELTE